MVSMKPTIIEQTVRNSAECFSILIDLFLPVDRPPIIIIIASVILPAE